MSIYGLSLIGLVLIGGMILLQLFSGSRNSEAKVHFQGTRAWRQAAFQRASFVAAD